MSFSFNIFYLFLVAHPIRIVFKIPCVRFSKFDSLRNRLTYI